MCNVCKVNPASLTWKFSSFSSPKTYVHNGIMIIYNIYEKAILWVQVHGKTHKDE